MEQLAPAGEALLHGVFAEIERFGYGFDRLVLPVEKEPAVPDSFQEFARPPARGWPVLRGR
jgi:hypothetical protein